MSDHPWKFKTQQARHLAEKELKEYSEHIILNTHRDTFSQKQRRDEDSGNWASQILSTVI